MGAAANRGSIAETFYDPGEDVVLGHTTPQWVWNELPAYFNRTIRERLHKPEIFNDTAAYTALVERATALYVHHARSSCSTVVHCTR